MKNVTWVVLSLFALYFSVLGKNCLTISKRPGHSIGGKKNIHEARIRIHSISYLYSPFLCDPKSCRPQKVGPCRLP